MPLPKRVLLDRSAFYALLSSTAAHHEMAKSTYERLIDRGQELWTTSCILTEVISSLQGSLGSETVSILMESIEDVVHIFWVEGSVFQVAWEQMLNVQSPELNIVDWITCAVARRLGCRLFTFNKGFTNLGMGVVPRQ